MQKINVETTVFYFYEEEVLPIQSICIETLSK